MRLTVVSHVVHFRHQGRLYAYGPYAREIEIWADLFHHVLIAAPLRSGPPPLDALPFEHRNIAIAPQPETGGDTLARKLLQILYLPVLLWTLARAMSSADAIHVRCPGNLGLLGAALAPLFSRRIVAKYAGQWHGGDYVAPTFRLQRWLLSSRWWRRGIVTVYGAWPGQAAQIVPFFTSMMTADQVDASQRAAARKMLAAPARLLYSGRLVPLKGIDVLLHATRLLRGEVRLTILGDGPEKPRLQQLAATLGIAGSVSFPGAVPFAEVMRAYDDHHILVLASNSEGWPKAVTEAMCHGVVCIASDEGLLPWMLQNRGLTVPVNDAPRLAEAIESLIADPALYRDYSRNAAQWARGYSIEGLREALRDLLQQRWRLPASALQSAPFSESVPQP